jgi:tetratricopeptide (TPR) repeat protein
MRTFAAVLFVSVLLGVQAGPAASDNWLFKGQPKEPGEHYYSPEAEKKTRKDQAQLLSWCDAKIPALKENTLPSTQDRHAEIQQCISCGLIYGVDHQRINAELFFQHGIDLARRNNSPAEEGLILINRAIVQVLWGQLSEALDCCNSALVVSIQAKDVQNQARVFNQIGQIHMFRGQYRQARENLEKALSLAADHDRLLVEDNLGQLFESWGLHEKAQQHYEESLRIKERLGFTGAEIASYLHLGRTKEQLGDSEGALTILHQGLEKAIKQGFAADNFHDRIGNILLENNDLARSELFIRNAGYWSSLGKLCLVKGQVSEAQPYYEKLLAWAHQRSSLDHLFLAHTGMGEICERKNELPKAVDHFQTAVDVSEELRQSLTVQERARFFNVKSGGFFRSAPYEGLARVLLKMNSPLQAFKISEHTKARGFAEAVARYPGNSSYGIPEDVLNRDRLLNEEYAAASLALNSARLSGSSDEAVRLESAVSDTKIKLNEHIERLGSQFPLFAATKYSQPMDLKQMSLRDDEWTLSYDVTDTGIIAYLTRGKDIVQSRFIPMSRGQLEQTVSQFRKAVEVDSAEDFLTKLKSFDLDLGKQLANLLLKDLLQHVPEGSVLIIAPDECLGMIPFEMLPLDGTGEVRTDRRIPSVIGVKFLGDRNPVCYVQSITALTLGRNLATRNSESNRMLVLADPVFDSNDERVLRSRPQPISQIDALYFNELMSPLASGENLAFARLQKTSNLAEYISGLLPGASEILTGLDASKPILLDRLKSVPSGYNTVVFATHGFYGHTTPGIMEPVLVLTTVPAGTDGLLRMTEIMGLRINTDMVVLAACQTGLGKLVTGEGILGMGRAFQYAGSRNVLMSLWSVEENASVKLLRHFVESRSKGKSKFAALTEARNQLRSEGYDHPFFWAAFVLAGDPD